MQEKSKSQVRIFETLARSSIVNLFGIIIEAGDLYCLVDSGRPRRESGVDRDGVYTSSLLQLALSRWTYCRFSDKGKC